MLHSRSVLVLSFCVRYIFHGTGALKACQAAMERHHNNYYFNSHHAKCEAKKNGKEPRLSTPFQGLFRPKQNKKIKRLKINYGAQEKASVRRETSLSETKQELQMLKQP